MTDIQQGLLNILLEIDEICKENDITYYLDGGSALGAWRHRGFLPWDDDADIMFTRENWLKFAKAVRENPRPNRSIEGMDNCPDYTMVYARYCATDTTCILRTSMIDQFQSGLFIDLFVLDPIPDTPESCKEYFDILHGYSEYLNPYYYDTVISTNEWYEHFKQMGAKQGRQAATDFVEQKLFSYPDEEGMTYGFRYDNGHFIYPRNVVGKPKYVPFENTYLPVAERIEDYLRIHYGDNWHMIPRAGEEESHNVVIDLNVPYDVFRDAYMPFIDRDQAIKDYQRLHELRLRQRRNTDFNDKDNYVVSSQLFANMFSARAAQEDRSIKQLIADGEYDMVRQMLDNYYIIQLNRWVLFHHVFVPLKDEHLYGALYLLLVDGDYPKADKILALRKEQDAPLSEELLQIDNLIAGIRDMVRAFEAKDARLAFRLCSKMLDAHPDIPTLRDGALRARGAMAIDRQDAAAATAALEDLDLAEKEDWLTDRLNATKQLLLLHFGEEEQQAEAIGALQELLEETYDGMLRLEIQDLLDAVLKTEETNEGAE